MNLKVFTLYVRLCKATNQIILHEELNQFEQELKENPNMYEVFHKKLKQLGY
ncbi:hypothetical protein [Clostridium sp. Marseille-Q2269]|uniref:hypothetical protein n=1 Tax=Clostridium sp. Marseille-Q2269 TaxID=2942205 RepID=UPI002073695E|nr:hypothetical protein [Clostridium sp. Marseille-Q2269]